MVNLTSGIPLEPTKPIYQPTIAVPSITTTPLTATLPTDDLGAKATRLEKNVGKLVDDYVENTALKDQRQATVLRMAGKMLLLAVIVVTAVITVPFTFGASLVIGGLIWGGVAFGGIAALGASSYLGLSKYHGAKLKETSEKLQKKGFTPENIEKLAKLKQEIRVFSIDKKETQKAIQKLSRKVENYVSKVSIPELNAMGIKSTKIDEISLEKKIIRMAEDSDENQKDLEKMGILIERVKAPRNLATEYAVVESHELFRALARSDAIMPLTGRVMFDPLRAKADRLQEEQNELLDEIVDEERLAGKIEGKLQKLQKNYDDLQSKLIREVLASQVTKTYLGQEAAFL